MLWGLSVCLKMLAWSSEALFVTRKRKEKAMERHLLGLAQCSFMYSVIDCCTEIGLKHRQAPWGPGLRLGKPPCAPQPPTLLTSLLVLGMSWLGLDAVRPGQ